MGNDGGSIPKRRELVKEAARLQTASEAKESQQEQQEYQWSTCPISQRPLKVPVVSDCSGTLYNKDAILEYLLPSDDPSVEDLKVDQEKIMKGRVKSLKDVVEVKFDVEEASEGGRTGSPSSQKWICPITNKTLGAAVKSVYIVPCGHAFAEIALKEVAETKCLQCSKSYTAENIISILPIAPLERNRLAKRAESLREQGLTHSLKKASGSGKKRKKHAADGEGIGSNKVADIATNENSKSPKAINGNNASTSGIKNASTASLTAKILAEEQEKAKRRKLERNENISKLFSSGPKGPQKDSDFMTRGHSVAADLQR